MTDHQSEFTSSNSVVKDTCRQIASLYSEESEFEPEQWAVLTYGCFGSRFVTAKDSQNGPDEGSQIEELMSDGDGAVRRAAKED